MRVHRKPRAHLKVSCVARLCAHDRMQKRACLHCAVQMRVYASEKESANTRALLHTATFFRSAPWKRARRQAVARPKFRRAMIDAAGRAIATGAAAARRPDDACFSGHRPQARRGTSCDAGSGPTTPAASSCRRACPPPAAASAAEVECGAA